MASAIDIPSKASHEVRAMFSSIAHRYDLTNSVLSCGMHYLWRRELIRQTPHSHRILDLCTGTADLVGPLSKRTEVIVGADFCLPMLKAGGEKREKANSIRGGLIQGDALSLPFASSSFDVVTVAFGIRNFENLDAGLSEIRRILKDKGTLLVLEFGQPSGWLWSKLYRFYSTFCIPRIGGLLTGNRRAYSYLPETSAQFPCKEELAQRMEKHGLACSFIKPLSGGIAYLYRAEAV